METALSWEEVQDLVISYGFVEDLEFSLAVYRIELNNITYTFRESDYGYYIIMDNKNYDGVRFPLMIKSETEFMDILRNSLFEELYGFLVSYKRNQLIDKFLVDLKDECN